MPRKPNPYIVGPPVSGRNFYGREDIFRFVQDTFSSPYQNVVVLWGQRRMGKTSVLHELPSRLSPEFHPIYFDLQDKAQQKLNEVLYDLGRKIAGSLNLDPPPRNDFLRDDEYFHERFLPQMYQSLGPKRLLFMLDEFDVDIPEEELVHDAAIQAFFPYLRRALMQDKQLAFVFVVGRRLDELDELLQSTFKMAKTAYVSFLEEAEARKLVVKPASGILEYDEEAVGRIISITACHPYLTQLVCSEIFSYMEAAGRARVTVNDVEAVVDKAIAVGTAGLAWLWGELPTAERFVLSAVAHAAKEGRATTQDEIDRILKEYRIPFSGRELTQAPDNLTTWGLLRRTADGYEFVVELLRRWILREHPLEQARRELESVSPRAIRWYELASELHRVVGELDGAIRFYKRALVINPNHVQARLGLAQALFELDRIEEAIKEYTEVYHLNEVMARDGLIAARQKRAEALEEAGKADEADQEYKTILNIAPYDLRVRKWVVDRWTARGRKYLAEGRYGEAIAEYEKATELDGPDAYEGLIAARRAWAEALEREDKVGEADQQYEAILGMAPDDDRLKEWVVGCWMARGKKYLEGERCEEAVAEYNKAVALGVSGAREGLIAARRTWAEVLEREDKADEADQQYETILDIVPCDDKLKEWVANCWMARGKKYLGGERYEEAVAEYEKAVALDVSDAREGLIAARRAWAEALEREDKAGEADQQYDAILGIAPDDESVREWVANSLIRRGDRYLEEGRYVEASQAYDQAESIQPEKQQALAQRRHWLELAPDYDRAMRAHEAGDWVTAEKEWAELYGKDRDYIRRDGKTVAVLLAEAIEKREGISQRRQRLIVALSGLVVVVAALSLWLGTSVLLPTSVPYPTYTPHPTYTPYPTPEVVEKVVTKEVEKVVTKEVEKVVTKEVEKVVTKEVEKVVTKEVEKVVTKEVEKVVVVTATPAPTPTPTLFPAPRLVEPEHGHKFFEGDAARVVLRWEPVGPLAENEWYQVTLNFFKSGEIQYKGNRLKESEWQVPEYFHGQADQPERAYYWKVTVIQVRKNPDGKETSIGRSPLSETWTFYWP